MWVPCLYRTSKLQDWHIVFIHVCSYVIFCLDMNIPSSSSITLGGWALPTGRLQGRKWPSCGKVYYAWAEGQPIEGSCCGTSSCRCRRRRGSTGVMWLKYSRLFFMLLIQLFKSQKSRCSIPGIIQRLLVSPDPASSCHRSCFHSISLGGAGSILWFRYEDT
jgi:hypothetical protein